MRYIKKREEAPKSFEKWKRRAKSPTYDELSKPEQHEIKNALHEALVEEQGFTCCYCGCRINVEEGKSHIEHFCPQSVCQDKVLDYENLHASCCAKDHCGYKKGREFDNAKHISPLKLDCEEHFIYTLYGEILLKNEKDENAAYMRDLLKLDDSGLRKRRRTAIFYAFLPYRDLIKSDKLALADNEIRDLAIDEIKKLQGTFRTLGKDGKYIEFAHVLAIYAEQLIGDTP